MAGHPLLTKWEGIVAEARASATSPASQAAVELAVVELYDALAEAPAGKRIKFRRNRKPSVTHILTSLGFRDPPYPGQRMDDGLMFGRHVHRVCELDDTGVLDESTVSDKLWPYLEGWRRFKHDTGSNVSQCWELELTSARYGFLGRLDNIRFLRGLRTLIDVKTNAADAATIHQMALYDLLTEGERHNDQSLTCRQWAALVIKPHDYRVVQWSKDERSIARADMLAALRTYNAIARFRGE
jgi:hypothetical protein